MLHIYIYDISNLRVNHTNTKIGDLLEMRVEEGSKSEVEKKNVNLTETLMSQTVRKHGKETMLEIYEGNTILNTPKTRTL